MGTTYLITEDLAMEFKRFLETRFNSPKHVKKYNELPGPNRVSVHSIKNLISRRYLAGSYTIETRCNVVGVVRPRMIAMYLSRKLTELSYPEIGKHFGGKHHTTVMYAIERVREDMLRDKKFAEEVESLERELTA